MSAPLTRLLRSVGLFVVLGAPVLVEQPGSAADPAPKVPLARLETGKEVSFIAFAPDGRSLLTADADSRFARWEVASGKLREVLPPPRVLPALLIEPSADGQLLALWTARDHTIHICDTATGKVRNRFPVAVLPEEHPFIPSGPFEVLKQLAWSPDKRLLAAVNGEGDIHVWRSATGKRVPSPPRERSAVQRIAFAPDGRALVVLALGSSQVLTLWELSTLLPRAQVDLGSTYDPGQVLIAPDGSVAALMRDDRELKLWPAGDATPGRAIRPPGGVTAAAFSPDGRLLAFGNRTGEVQFLRTGSSTPVASFSGTPIAVRAVASFSGYPDAV